MSLNTKPEGKRRRSSRRDFLGVAAGVAGGALLEPGKLMAQGRKGVPPAPAVPAIPGIQIAPAFTESLASPVVRADFSGEGITGAQVFANLCKDENLGALFCAPGNYNVINAIAAVGIPCYGGRNEGSMASAADGFYRVTGEVTACSGTEGPGFCNMIMNIAVAHFANTPLLVLASNQTLKQEDNYSHQQWMYQQPVTETLKKYGKRITVPERVYEYGAHAFRNLKTGVPGLAHLDFPGEVAGARFTDPSKLSCYYPKDHYRSESRACPTPKEVEQTIDMINRAERPVLIAGHGVFHRKAWEPLLRAAEKNEFAVAGSGPMRGHFPDDHRLSASMANSALLSADLVIFVGQYLMPNTGEYTLPPGIKTIRVHPEQGDLGKNWPVDLGIVSDEGYFLEALADGVPRKKRDAWVAELAAATQKFEKVNLDHYALGLKYSRDTGRLHPAVLCKEVHDFLYKGDLDPKLTTTGYGGHTMSYWGGRWLRANRPGQEVVTLYQFGAMGPDLAMAMGAAAAVQQGVGPQAPYKGSPVLALTGDAGVVTASSSWTPAPSTRFRSSRLSTPTIVGERIKPRPGHPGPCTCTLCSRTSGTTKSRRDLVPAASTYGREKSSGPP